MTPDFGNGPRLFLYALLCSSALKILSGVAPAIDTGAMGCNVPSVLLARDSDGDGFADGAYVAATCWAFPEDYERIDSRS